MRILAGITLENFIDHLSPQDLLKALTLVNARLVKQKKSGAFCLHAPGVHCLNCIEP